jgi:beta-glucanase (GH16 family)
MTKPELSLIWEQDFNEPSGTLPNPKVWNFNLGDGSEYGIPGWGNQEREFYTDKNVATDGSGNLVISADRYPLDEQPDSYYGKAEWSSAKLTTLNKVHFKYGRFEARLKLPSGLGTWPALWLLGTDIETVPWPQCGEIDIVESRGDQPTSVYGTLHGPGYFGDKGKGLVFEAPDQLFDEYHEFAIEWLPNEIRWFYDGVMYHKNTASEIAPLEWVYNHDFYLITNLAMGGNFTGAIDPELNHAELAIDYIKVFSIDGVGEVIHQN